MTNLNLDIAIATYGHTAALKDGRVAIKGVQANFLEINPIIAAFRRMVRDVEFDVCEMAPATYMIARAAGAPFKALPVFIFRRFHHNGFVVRGDSGIRTPKDLEGKKAGVRAYSVSTGIWSRGIFAEDYGMDNSKVTWVVDDEEHVTTLKLPGNVIKAQAGQSLVSMMADGQIQAAFTGPAGIGRAGLPQEGWEKSAPTQPTEIYNELIPDADKVSAEWFKRTGIYPTHGLIVVKDSLLAAHPWLGKALFAAFSEAKAIYLKQLQAGDLKNDTDRNYANLSKVVGDPLPYGIEQNRPAIEALIRYSYQQGLLPKHYSIGEMFIDPKA